MNLDTQNTNTFTVEYDPNRSMEDVVSEEIQRRMGPKFLPIHLSENTKFDKRIRVEYRIKDRGRYRSKSSYIDTTEGELIIRKTLMENTFKQIIDKPQYQPLTTDEFLDLKQNCRSVLVILSHLKIRGTSKKVIRSLKKGGYPKHHIDSVREYVSNHPSEMCKEWVENLVGWYVSMNLSDLKNRDHNLITYTDNINVSDEEVDDYLNLPHNPNSLRFYYDNDPNELRKGLKKEGYLNVETSFVGGVQ